MKILVLENDPLIKPLMRDLLEANGYEVLEATTVAEAREILAREKPCLCFMDVNLEEGDSLELMTEWRKRTTIIAMSGIPANKEKVLASGAKRFLEKPIIPFLEILNIAEDVNSRSGL